MFYLPLAVGPIVIPWFTQAITCWNEARGIWVRDHAGFGGWCPERHCPAWVSSRQYQCSLAWCLGVAAKTFGCSAPTNEVSNNSNVSHIEKLIVQPMRFPTSSMSSWKWMGSRLDCNLLTRSFPTPGAPRWRWRLFVAVWGLQTWFSINWTLHWKNSSTQCQLWRHEGYVCQKNNMFFQD